MEWNDAASNSYDRNADRPGTISDHELNNNSWVQYHPPPQMGLRHKSAYLPPSNPSS
jgi:hypothetical protein